MNMFVFEEVAAGTMSPEAAAERLVAERESESEGEASPHGRLHALHHLALAALMVVLGAFVPSLVARRF
jgi:hypothetical protein